MRSKERCGTCGSTYRKGQNHPLAKCQFVLATRGPNKFGAERTSDGTRSYMSKGESDCGQYLKWMQQAGEIRDLEFQVSIRLPEPDGPRYVMDFKFFDVRKGELIFADYKRGLRTQRWNDGIRLWRLFGPAPLREYGGSGDRITLTKEIRPKGNDQ